MTISIVNFSTQHENDNHFKYDKESLERCKKMKMAVNHVKTYLEVHQGMLFGCVMSEKMREHKLDKVKVIHQLVEEFEKINVQTYLLSLNK